MTETLNPETDWGEVELRVDFVEGTTPTFDSNGVPAKLYRSMRDALRASSDLCGRYAAEPDLKGMTKIIKRRRGAERETPPGYTGGAVVVSLLPTFRYWRFNQGTGSLEKLSGRIAVGPDEAAQIVATGSATYAA